LSGRRKVLPAPIGERRCDDAEFQALEDVEEVGI
jgi:hypothetical protein